MLTSVNYNNLTCSQESAVPRAQLGAPVFGAMKENENQTV